MRNTRTFAFAALLLVMAQSVWASALGYPFRLQDDAGALVSGATIAIAGTTVAASTNGAAPSYTAVTVKSASNFASLASINVAYYDAGNGDYLLVYDAEANGDAYIPLTVSKAGSTITQGNALLPIIATREAGRVLNNLDAQVSTRSNHTPAQVRSEMDANSTQLAKLGTPAGASLAADIAAIMTRLGVPSGASIAADIATRLASSAYTTPPTASANGAAAATAILVTPANKLQTDGTGQVTSTNAGTGLTNQQQTQLAAAAGVATSAPSWVPANFALLNINGSGQFTAPTLALAPVPTVPSATDNAAAVWADPHGKAVVSNAKGRYTFDPSTGVMTFYDVDTNAILFSFTITASQATNLAGKVPTARTKGQ